MLSQCYSIGQAARLLAVSEDLLRKFIKRHQIETITLGRRRVIEQGVLERILRLGLPSKGTEDRGEAGG